MTVSTYILLRFISKTEDTQRREGKRNRGVRQRWDRQPQMRYGTRLCRGWREGVQLLTGGRRVSQPTTTLSLAILKPF